MITDIHRNGKWYNNCEIMEKKRKKRRFLLTFAMEIISITESPLGAFGQNSRGKGGEKE